MWFANNSAKLVTSILVIVLLGAAFAFVCSEGVHLPFSRTADGACAVMPHSNGVAAILGSESAPTLASQVMVLAAAFAFFVLLGEEPSRLVWAKAAPGRHPDPLHGRLRI